jgi:hypothetical protein
MKNRVLFTGMVILLALSLAFLTGCPTEAAENLPLTSLVDSVWVGEPAAEDWATLNFKANNQAAFLLASVGIFNGGSSPSGDWAAYTYDADAKTGSVNSVDSALGAAPGSFTISGDTKVLTFANYQGSGSSRAFKRVRPDAENTFTLDALPEDLVGTVWGATNPMQDGGWITLAFTPGNQNAGAFTHDNTSRIRNYTYDNTESPKAGNIGSGINGFIINAAGDTLTLANMFGHGTPIDLKRFR